MSVLHYITMSKVWTTCLHLPTLIQKLTGGNFPDYLNLKHLSVPSLSLFLPGHPPPWACPPPPSQRGWAAAYRPWRRAPLCKELSSCAVCAPPKNIFYACPLKLEEETNSAGFYLTAFALLQNILHCCSIFHTAPITFKLLQCLSRCSNFLYADASHFALLKFVKCFKKYCIAMFLYRQYISGSPTSYLRQVCSSHCNLDFRE